MDVYREGGETILILLLNIGHEALAVASAVSAPTKHCRQFVFIRRPRDGTENQKTPRVGTPSQILDSGPEEFVSRTNSTDRRRERQCRFLFAKRTLCFVIIEISRERVLGFWVRRYYLTNKLRTLTRTSRTFRRGKIKIKNTATSTHVI